MGAGRGAFGIIVQKDGHFREWKLRRAILETTLLCDVQCNSNFRAPRIGLWGFRGTVITCETGLRESRMSLGGPVLPFVEMDRTQAQRD